jgi:hypothetical protein
VEIPTGRGTVIAAYGHDFLEVGMERVRQWRRQQEGKGYLPLWALGVPIPVLFVIVLLRGCT